jgi:Tfp pilus assembly PilM family ATPase
MIKLSTTRKRRQPGGTRRNTLGIDIGTAAIKMARMVWQDERWTVGNRLILPLRTKPDNFSQDVHDGLLSQQLQPLQNRPLAQNHDCACVLPMSLTDLRSVDVPDGNEGDVEQMALESLKDLYPDDFDDRITRPWRQSEPGNGMAHVASLSLPDILAARIVEQLSGARLNCGAIDGLPFALARAAEMSPIGRASHPIALLDWGHTSVTFVVSREGHPEFVRTFRDCGGHRSVDAIAQGLGLDHSDALNVLTTFGLPGDGSAAAVAQSVNSLIAPELQRISGELRKTLLYLQHHVSSLIPSQLVLFGGMATVPNVAAAVQDQSDLKTSVWSLNDNESNQCDPLYAVAMAASVGDLWQ